MKAPKPGPALLLMLLISTIAWCQPKMVYTVIKASGKVHSSLLNRELKTGDENASPQYL